MSEALEYLERNREEAAAENWGIFVPTWFTAIRMLAEDLLELIERVEKLEQGEESD